MDPGAIRRARLPLPARVVAGSLRQPELVASMLGMQDMDGVRTRQCAPGAIDRADTGGAIGASGSDPMRSGSGPGSLRAVCTGETRDTACLRVT